MTLAPGARARIRAAIDLNRPQEALRLLGGLQASEPENGDLWMLRGEALFDLRQYPPGQDALERALALDPSLHRAHFLLALCLWNGQWTAKSPAADVPDRIHDALREALRLHSQSAAYLTQLGRFFMQRGDLVSAQDTLHEALSLDPLHAYALTSLAQMCWQRGEIAKVEELTLRLLQHDPEQVQAKVLLAQVRWEQNRPHEAFTLSLAALKGAAPGSSDATSAREHFGRWAQEYLWRPWSSNDPSRALGAIIFTWPMLIISARNIWRFRRLPREVQVAVRQIKPRSSLKAWVLPLGVVSLVCLLVNTVLLRAHTPLSDLVTWVWAASTILFTLLGALHLIITSGLVRLARTGPKPWPRSPRS